MSDFYKPGTPSTLPPKVSVSRSRSSRPLHPRVLAQTMAAHDVQPLRDAAKGPPPRNVGSVSESKANTRKWVHGHDPLRTNVKL